MIPKSTTVTLTTNLRGQRPSSRRNKDIILSKTQPPRGGVGEYDFCTGRAGEAPQSWDRSPNPQLWGCRSKRALGELQGDNHRHPESTIRTSSCSPPAWTTFSGPWRKLRAYTALTLPCLCLPPSALTVQPQDSMRPRKIMGTERAVAGQWITALDADAELARETPPHSRHWPQGCCGSQAAVLACCHFLPSNFGVQNGQVEGVWLKGLPGKRAPGKRGTKRAAAVMGPHVCTCTRDRTGESKCSPAQVGARAWHNPAVVFHSAAQEGNGGLLPHQLPWLCWTPPPPELMGGSKIEMGAGAW